VLSQEVQGEAWPTQCAIVGKMAASVGEKKIHYEIRKNEYPIVIAGFTELWQCPASQSIRDALSKCFSHTNSLYR
jgi:hypothetical protein